MDNLVYFFFQHSQGEGLEHELVDLELDGHIDIIIAYCTGNEDEGRSGQGIISPHRFE